MFKKIFFAVSICSASMLANAQKFANYTDSLKNFREHYIRYHEVVKDSNKQFLQFFPVDTDYKVTSRFEYATNTKWFTIKTSGNTTKLYRRYGTIYFNLNHTDFQLQVYQAQALMETKEYADYLFIPFTDLTNGVSTYASGKYIDASTKDIVNNSITIDFNKSYNPYCAYTTGYNCPIPPAENFLNTAILAGEKMYAKKH